MKRFLFIIISLLSISLHSTIAFAQNPSFYVEYQGKTLTQHIGTLHTDMRGNPHDIQDFKLYYSQGTLQIPEFQVGKMPGSIYVYATGITEGTTQRCPESVTLNILGFKSQYDADIMVENVNNKIHVTIDVIKPKYEGTTIVAHVDFKENK